MPGGDDDLYHPSFPPAFTMCECVNSAALAKRKENERDMEPTFRARPTPPTYCETRPPPTHSYTDVHYLSFPISKPGLRMDQRIFGKRGEGFLKF